MASDKLTVKQQAFVKAYMETGNASEAYRRSYNVGKSTKPETVNRKAIEVLQNGNVSARIAEVRSAAAEKVVVDQAWVLERLMRNARIAMGEEKIKVSIRPKGTDGRLLDATVELEITDRDPAAANKALELLGKHLGMFKEVHEHTGKDGGPIEVNTTTDELVSRISRLAARSGAHGGARRDH
jgi:phage terminase small subunit